MFNVGSCSPRMSSCSPKNFEELVRNSYSPRLSPKSSSPLFLRLSPGCPSPDVFEFLYEALQHSLKPKGPLYFKTSQEDCSGEFSIPTAIHMITSVNSALKTKEISGVWFDSRKLEHPISGGTCSAMSFNFAKEYLNQNPLFSCLGKIENIKLNFETSCHHFRIEQAALNTISIKPTLRQPLHTKVEALATAYGFEITNPSDEFYFHHSEGKKRFKKYFNSLDDGIYFLRVIKPHDFSAASITKQETCGHSMLLIQELSQHIFYDPDHGIYDLSESAKPANFVYNMLEEMAKLCKYSHGAFFQLSID